MMVATAPVIAHSSTAHVWLPAAVSEVRITGGLHLPAMPVQSRVHVLCVGD